MGSIEFDYEGNSEFTENSIKNLFTHMESLSLAKGAVVGQPQATPHDDAIRLNKVHTATIAARMDAKNATDLAVAAAAHLQIIESKQVFTRQELLDDMKSASTYFKSTMVNNLTSTMKRLTTNGFFNQVTNTTYSLSEAKRSEMEILIAQ